MKKPKRSPKQNPEAKQYKPREKTREQWQRDAETEKSWRKTLAEWEVSGLTIRAFAKLRGLKEPSIYAWRREIRIRNCEAAVATNLKLDESQPARAECSYAPCTPESPQACQQQK